MTRRAMHHLRFVSAATIYGLTALVPPARCEPPKVAAVSVLVGTWLVEERADADHAPSPLRSPFGVAFDAQGHMYIVELEGGRIHERLPDGTLRVMAGDGSKSYRGDGGLAGQATFNGMHNVAISRGGRMYIADSWNHCVREIDLKTRRIRTLAGNGQAGFAGDGGPAAEAQFDYLMCVTLNPAEDTLHVADLRNRRIRAIDLRTLTVQTVAGNGQRGVPRDGSPAADSPLVDPRAVAADANGRIYVLERGGHALRLVRPDGTIHTVAGTGSSGYRDGPALQAQFAAPKHLCVDPQGRVYIADDLNAAVRCYDPDTQSVTTLLGRGQGDPRIRLLHPHGVCFHGDALYVVDTGHDRVLRVELAR
jgi:sugar lactone lactonase YvrE